MPEYRTPGVYTQEIPTLPPSVAPVDTAVPVFIGYTKLHDANVPLSDGTDITKPRKIFSMNEYVQLFGGSYSGLTVNVSLSSGIAVVDTVEFDDTDLKNLMYYSIKWYFLNGGGPCYIVSLRENNSTIAAADYTSADLVSVLEKADEPTLLVLPDLVNVDGSYYAILQSMLGHCAKMQDRFLIMDVKGTETVDDFRDDIGSLNLNYGAAYLPYMVTGFEFEYTEADVTFDGTNLDGYTLEEVIALIAENGSGAGAIASEFTLGLVTDIRNAVNEAVRTINGVSTTLVLPPSGAVAGVYYAIDSSRGVWKAPANVSLNGVEKPVKKYQPTELDDLNVPDDGFGKALNVIRDVVGRGTMIMGARTLDGNSLEWRYVPVRRLFIFVEESISKAMNNFVFEANDANSWNRVKGTIGSFLNDLWQQGALLGEKPSQAYFVKVGLNETMIADDILNGRMIVEVGLAAVRPAEFVVVRFSHKLQVS